MILYYDKQGRPILDTIEWGKLFEDKDYKIIKQEYTPNKKYWVSTVWLGIDHMFGWPADRVNPNPIIFETMVFGMGDNDAVDYSADTEQERYSSVSQALRGHAKLLKEYTKKELKNK